MKSVVAYIGETLFILIVVGIFIQGFAWMASVL